MATYVVKSGDTLSGIARKLGISNWQTLYNQNKSVIGSNPNLIRSGQQLTYGTTTPTASTTTPTQSVTPAVSAGTQAGTQAGQAVALTPFGEVLPFNQYFNPELVQGSAEQAYANYYAPIVQQAQGNLESTYAGRGLTRSGIRGQALGDLYRQYGQEQQAGIEADVLQQKANAQQEYNMLQDLYESTEGKQKPAATAYTPYKVAKPTTSAGTYGTSYLDWLNRATRA